MPEEWAEVELPCSAAVPDFSRDQQWGPGGESPVCCTCSRAPQNKQKKHIIALTVSFSSPLVTLLSFPTHTDYLPLSVDPFHLSLSLAGLDSIWRQVLLRAERKLLHTETLFSLTRMYSGLQLSFPVFVSHLNAVPPVEGGMGRY